MAHTYAQVLSLEHPSVYATRALLANMVVVPLAFLLVTSGFCSLLAGLLLAPLGVLFNHAALALAGALGVAMQAFAALPGGSMRVLTFTATRFDRRSS